MTPFRARALAPLRNTPCGTGWRDHVRLVCASAQLFHSGYFVLPMFPARAASTQDVPSLSHPLRSDRLSTRRAAGGCVAAMRSAPRPLDKQCGKRSREKRGPQGPRQCQASKSGLPTCFSRPARSSACPFRAPAAHFPAPAPPSFLCSAHAEMSSLWCTLY